MDDKKLLKCLDCGNNDFGYCMLENYQSIYIIKEIDKCKSYYNENDAKEYYNSKNFNSGVIKNV